MKSKKLVAMLLALCMIFALAACSPKDDGDKEPTPSQSSDSYDPTGGADAPDYGESGNSLFNKSGADVVLDHDEPDGGLYIQTTPKN